MDFLDPENIAGQSLLQLVARGSSIITELLRLSHIIPQEFHGPYHTNAADQKKYDQVLFDFSYLKASDAYDQRIDRDLNNVDLDEEIRETHFPLLERFYTLFEGMTKYMDNLSKWLHDLKSGVFLNLDLEPAFDDKDATQLLCEALSLAGTMLLLLDLRVPGAVRERIIIAYYRYKGPHLVHTIDKVRQLVRDSGFVANHYPFLVRSTDHTSELQTSSTNIAYSPEQLQMSITLSNLPQSMKPQRPANYPVDYFKRVLDLPPDYIELTIAKLRTDDIYFHMSSFPGNQHQTIALADQAAMLYVCLYFQPTILQTKNNANFTTCRDIISRFFVDNFIISLPGGISLDIMSEWYQFQNMNQAMMENFTKDALLERVTFHQTALPKIIKDCEALLVEGVLTDEYVMDNHKKILNLLRASNWTLRWSLLHSHATIDTKLSTAIKNKLPANDLLQLLLSSSSLESQLKSMVERLITGKEQRWEYLRNESSDLTLEISEVFGGIKALSRTKKNDKLQKWFVNVTDEIKSLSYDAGNLIAGRTIQQLLNALTAVQENHQVEQSMQVVQGINDVKKHLQEMLRLSNMTPKILADIDTITDMTYASRIVTLYTPIIHKKIASSPSLCLMLRSVFQKLSCILNTPLVRILQSQSEDSISVAQYYSNELVQYVTQVLDIVPLSVFKLLDGISVIMDRLNSKKLPLKIERHLINDIAKLNERQVLARYTNNISVFTRGVLGMSSTLLGIVKLDPQDILQNGIRKHLVLQVTNALHTQLLFLTPSSRLTTLNEFESKLLQVGHKLTGLRDSLEYIQDFLNVYGLKIWQEEMCRMVNFYIEQERNRYIKKKVVSWQSAFQSEVIPIPLYTTNTSITPSSSVTQVRDGHKLYGELAVSHNFMGRVLNELTKYSVPTHYIYSPAQLCWVGNGHSGQAPLGQPSVTLRTFALLTQGLSVFGLAGLDNLISFVIVRELGIAFNQYAAYTSTTASGPTGANLPKDLMLQSIDSSLGHSLYPMLTAVQNQLLPTSQFPSEGVRIYTVAQQKTEKVWLNSGLLQRIIKVGQLQLLRKHFQQELQYNAKSESPALFNAISTLNTSLMNELGQHYSDPEQYNYPGNPILPEFSKFINVVGKTDPLDQIYSTTQQSTLHYVSLSLFLLTITTVPFLTWSKVYNTLIPATKQAAREYHIDGIPFVVGIITFLKQLHSSHTHLYLQLLGQYVRSVVSLSLNVTMAGSGSMIGGTGTGTGAATTTESDMSSQISTLKKLQEKQSAAAAKQGQTNINSSDVHIPLLPAEATRVLMFLELYCEYADVNRETVTSVVPPYLLDALVRI